MNLQITFRLSERHARAFLAIKDEGGFDSPNALAKSIVVAVIEDDMKMHSPNGARAAPPPASRPASPQESRQ